MGCSPHMPGWMMPPSHTAASILHHCSPDLPPMPSFEGITPGTNRPEGRLQPTQPGTALIRRGAFRFSHDPDVAGANLRHLGFGRGSFKRNVHVFVPRLKSSNQYNVLLTTNSIECPGMAGHTIPPARRLSRDPIVPTQLRNRGAWTFGARRRCCQFLMPDGQFGRQPSRRWGWRTPLKKTTDRPNQKSKKNNRLHSPGNGIRCHPHNRPAPGRRLPRATPAESRVPK